MVDEARRVRVMESWRAGGRGWGTASPGRKGTSPRMARVDAGVKDISAPGRLYTRSCDNSSVLF